VIIIERERGERNPEWLLVFYDKKTKWGFQIKTQE